jgi:hypothetical protein
MEKILSKIDKLFLIDRDKWGLVGVVKIYFLIRII